MREVHATSNPGSAAGGLLVLLEFELPGGRLVFANRAARSLFGPELADAQPGGVIESDGLLEAVISDGDEREFECHLTAADGRRMGACALARRPRADRLEVVLVPLGIGLGQAARDAAVLATVSHDLRSPLSAILTTTALLKMRFGEQAGRQLDTIERSAERIHRLVESLLDRKD